MRIIAGTKKGIRIQAPPDLPVRPTTDTAKEALFNILENNFILEQSKVLDLFSGTGNIAYEFASRNCEHITAVDLNSKCCNFIRSMQEKLQFNIIEVVKNDVFSYMKKSNSSFDIVFADPPYALNNIRQIPSLVFEQNLLRPGGWLIVEHASQLNMETPHRFDQRIYGQSSFSFYKQDAP